MARRSSLTANPLMPAGAVATVIYVAFVGLPLIALIIRALGGDGFLDSITGSVARQALMLSLVTSAVSILIILALGTPFAYLLARSDSRLLRIVDTIVELPIVLPPVVAGVAMLMAFGRRGILGAPLDALGIELPFTTAAVVMAQLFVAGPFYIRAAKLGFEAVSTEMEDVSQTLGVSPWATFWRLTLPLSWPALVGGAALAWARAISEFGATIMFAGNFTGRTQTMPLAILTALESDIPTALAISVLLVFASVVVLVVLGLVARRATRRYL